MPGNGTMRRFDLFMLSMTAFVFANCLSCFACSSIPHLTGWGTAPNCTWLSEAVGFPFVMFTVANVLGHERILLSWWNGTANVAVAVAISYVLSRHLAGRLPAVWPALSRKLQYSLRSLLTATVLVCVFLGMAVGSSSCGLVLRNSLCFAGPACAIGWAMCRRQASWACFLVAALALTLLVLAIDFRYQKPPIRLITILQAIQPNLPFPAMDQCDGFDWHEYAARVWAKAWIGLTMTRVLVPIWGLSSLFVLFWAVYSIRRPILTAIATFGLKPRSDE